LNAPAESGFVENAEALIALGFRILPLRSGQKQSLGRWAEFRTRVPSSTELRTWAERNVNLGVITGRESNVVVLDLDRSEAITEARRRGLPDTPCVKTPRGLHFYFRHPRKDARNKVNLFPGADFRGDGGYVVGPGSVYAPSPEEIADGKLSGSYDWIVDPSSTPFAEVPGWLGVLLDCELVDRRCEPQEAKPAQGCEFDLERLRNAVPGERNVLLNLTAFEGAMHCAAGLGSEPEIKEQLREIAYSLGLSPSEIDRTIKSGWDAGTLKAPIDPTEDGLALAFTRRFGSDFLFDPSSGQWAQWNSTRWIPEAGPEVIDLLRELGRRADGKVLRTHRAVRGADALLRSDKMHRLPRAWDSNPLLLGTTSGVVDLSSGHFRRARKEDLILRSTGFDPEKRMPWRWLRFLLESAGRDRELVRFLQRFMGYSLTGHTKEQVLLFIYGDGGNGKSVFLEVFQRCLGDYACAANMDAFMVTASDRHPTEMARLDGARLVTSSETRANSRWDEQKLKELTGGDTVTARFMRQDFFQYRPQFKLVFVGNHKPRLHAVDSAIKRRLLMIPFTLKPKRVDPDLGMKLREEAEAILAWMISGCLEWQRVGLKPPPVVLDETEAYFEAEDVVGAWIKECCVTGPDQSATPTELFSSWSEYALRNELSPGSIAQMGATLEAQGFKRAKSNGVRYHRGISVERSVRDTRDRENLSCA
jgi:putative DNA primase/helicase